MSNETTVDPNLNVTESIVIDASSPNSSPSLSSKSKNQNKKLAAVSGKKKHTGCRKEITSEEKSIYSKAFIVWALFTLGGWLSIPNEYLPLFSHCVGFGFFLTITTRRTRWLGFLAVGALIFSILMYFSMPPEWVFMVSNSAGYVAMGLALVLAYLCSFASPQSIREGVTNVRKNELYLTGSRYLEEMARFALAPSGQTVPEGGKRLEEDGKQIPTDQKERQLEILESVPREALCVIIKQLNARLMARDEEAGKVKEANVTRIKRLTSQIDAEVDKRLKAENVIAKQEEQMKLLAEQLENEKGIHILPVISLEKQLKDSQEMQRRLNEEVQRLQRESREETGRLVELEKKFHAVVEKKEKLQKEVDSLLEAKLKEEKKVHRGNIEKAKLERQIQEEKECRAKLEKQLQEEKEIKKKSDDFYSSQMKVLTEVNRVQLKKFKEESTTELKRRQKQTLEIAQKAETLVRKQQEKMAKLEAELRALREEKRQHRKLFSSFLGGGLSDTELKKLTPRQLELLYGELQLGLQRLSALGKQALDEAVAGSRSTLRSDPTHHHGMVADPKFAISPPHSNTLEFPEMKDQRHLQGIQGWFDWSPESSDTKEKPDSEEDLLRLSSLLMSSLQTSHIQSPTMSSSRSPKFGSIEELNCLICKITRINAFLYPCGHPCICSLCATKLLDATPRTPLFCPVCHIPAESWHSLENPDVPSLRTDEFIKQSSGS